METMVKNEIVHSFWDFKAKDSLIDTFFLMKNPYSLLIILAAYIMLIGIVPKIMKSRPPMKLNKIMLVYNLFQVCLSSFICYKVYDLGVMQDGILYAGCRFSKYSNDLKLLTGCWWYFFAKITELLDTVFFVFRKKNRQVTFLHVYHHIIMMLYMWCCLKYAVGGDGAIQAFINCSVHIVMYTYYLLAGLGSKYHKYLWWKKYVTKMQLVQFIIVLCYNTWTYFSPKCNFHSGFTLFISANTAVFICLFLNFYIKNYNKSNNKRDDGQLEGQNHIKKDFTVAHVYNGVTKRAGL